jgi:methylthioribulose-1-phosphate dehydratase
MTNDSSEALVELCRLFGRRQWCPATGGNFSLRRDDAHIQITRSGSDKSRLSADDLMLCDLDGRALDAAAKPSAETALHTCLYRLDHRIGAVLHTHSVTSTVLSRATPGDLRLRGFEMQKALAGNHGHEEEIVIAVFDNDQDIAALATRVERRWHDAELTQPGFLVRGHGLYAWGETLDDARRHIEGFEFLFACAWQEMLLRNK